MLTGRLPTGTESTEFFYGPDRQYYRQEYNGPGGTEITHYVGGILEKVYDGTTFDWRHYIKAEGQTVAIVSRKSSGTNAIKYSLEDNQGSGSVLVDSGGTGYTRQSYAAYGLPRDGNDWDGAVPSGDASAINAITRRGYTGHSMLASMGLIHMNGRVQDAVTGRFLSPDPFVFNPGSTQSYNRYAYVSNNPLSFTDPSGFCFVRGNELCEVEVTATRPPRQTPRNGCYVRGDCYDFYTPPPGLNLNGDPYCFYNFSCLPSPEGGDGSGVGPMRPPPPLKEPTKKPLPQTQKPPSESIQEFNACVRDKVGSLGWAIDGLTSVFGFDTDFESGLQDNYDEFVALSTSALAVSQWAAQPATRELFRSANMLTGEVAGGRAGAVVGRILGRGRGYSIRTGIRAGGAATRAVGVVSAFTGGYLAGAAGSCAISQALD